MDSGNRLPYDLHGYETDSETYSESLFEYLRASGQTPGEFMHQLYLESYEPISRLDSEFPGQLHHLSYLHSELKRMSKAPDASFDEAAGLLANFSAAYRERLIHESNAGT